jgi:hypothetical protein
MEPIRIGSVPAGLGTPDLYATVRKNDRPYLRLDLYKNTDEFYEFEEVRIWHQFVITAFGHSVFLVHLDSRGVISIDLGSYFCSLYISKNYLLIISAERLFRVDTDGSVKWSTQQLGIDGVIVDSVEDGVIQGRGQWNPPNGWQPFRLRLSSGSLL